MTYANDSIKDVVDICDSPVSAKDDFAGPSSSKDPIDNGAIESVDQINRRHTTSSSPDSAVVRTEECFVWASVHVRLCNDGVVGGSNDGDCI